ncbi:MAG TPA: LysR family transcriptional regulator [Casimicrobiaceae bacterium]|nr:LysR family transcriptional regulator [Casimicrobiaceae bacterium]
MIDLRTINIFLTLAESGSFTLAARRLAKTQSAVSQAIRQLEEELGVVLIDRSERPLCLTPAGELLRDRGYQLIDDLNATTASIRERAESKRPEIRVGFVDSFAMTGGAQLMKDLLGYAQNLTLWSGLTPRLGQALAERKVDIIVANNSFDDIDGLVRFELMREPYVLLAPNEPAYAASGMSLAKLAASFPMVCYDTQSFMATQIERHFRRLNIRPTRRVYVDSTDKLIAMVAGGVGWTSSTSLALYSARNPLAQVKASPFPGRPFYRQLFMISHAGGLRDLTTRLAAQARQLLADRIVGELVATFPWLKGQIVVPEGPDAA